MSNLFKCSLCGAQENKSFYRSVNSISELIKKEYLCFSCAFWTDMINNPIRDGCIYKSCYYKALPTDDPIKGLVCWVFEIKTHQVKQVKLVSYGKIPSNFLPALSNEYRVITQKTLEEINSSRCFSKGCLDRYTCMRYELWKEKRPFNKVPKNYIAGTEKCYQFINQNAQTI